MKKTIFKGLNFPEQKGQFFDFFGKFLNRRFWSANFSMKTAPREKHSIPRRRAQKVQENSNFRFLIFKLLSQRRNWRPHCGIFHNTLDQNRCKLVLSPCTLNLDFCILNVNAILSDCSDRNWIGEKLNLLLKILKRGNFVPD